MITLHFCCCSCRLHFTFASEVTLSLTISFLRPACYADNVTCSYYYISKSLYCNISSLYDCVSRHSFCISYYYSFICLLNSSLNFSRHFVFSSPALSLFFFFFLQFVYFDKNLFSLFYPLGFILLSFFLNSRSILFLPLSFLFSPLLYSSPLSFFLFVFVFVLRFFLSSLLFIYSPTQFLFVR